MELKEDYLQRTLRHNCVMFMDENDFIKKVRSLKKYCPKAYKFLMFEFMKQDIYNCKSGAKLIKELPTSEEFKSIYGTIKLIYSKYNNKIVLEDIEPSKFLIDGYRRDLDTYKGIPIRDKKDIFKVNLFFELKER